MKRSTNLAEQIFVETDFANAVRIGDKISTAARRCWGATMALMAGWAERARTRRELLSMTDRDLTDIRFNRAGARDEAAKPFWRA